MNIEAVAHRVISVISPVLVAVDTLLVANGAYSAHVGAEVGVVWAAIAAGFGVKVGVTALQTRIDARKATR